LVSVATEQEQHTVGGDIDEGGLLSVV